MPKETELKSITSLRITPGQMVWAFDGDGKQVAELQMSLLELWAERATKAGYSVDGIVCEMSPMDRWRIVKAAEGGKWMVERA